MMKVVKRIAGLVALVGILATASFATPVCALCAPFARQHDVIQSVKSAHDHCGSRRVEAPDPGSVASSHCGHSTSICMFPAEREHPAMQLASPHEVSFDLVTQAEAVITQDSISPWLTDPIGLTPTPLLLTTNLRV